MLQRCREMSVLAKTSLAVGTLAYFPVEKIVAEADFFCVFVVACDIKRATRTAVVEDCKRNDE